MSKSESDSKQAAAVEEDDEPDDWINAGTSGSSVPAARVSRYAKSFDVPDPFSYDMYSGEYKDE
ncbi:hypothetical protein LOCC1_G007225 [Lachnellula occidentalis]|uniref:Uncharacterized protein n=1 Tax=Lachnellula occidentalis TaxID=215460 RepID=A0A8H8RET5_9HELO|nr:hypothetical protein LOCC1_G007225 [Lachnellula occidentalis]